MIAKPRHRWFRFTLRTMFVLVTVFCCWLGYSMNWIRQRHAWLAEHHTGIIEGHAWLAEHYPGIIEEVRAPAGLWLFGETGVEYLWIEIDIENGHRLFPEAKVVRVESYPEVYPYRSPRIEITPYSDTAPPSSDP